ncbi:MAG: hypothetical protein P8J32_09155, partial [bacterium]|nr:hypothetical protein [bacterium]
WNPASVMAVVALIYEHIQTTRGATTAADWKDVRTVLGECVSKPEDVLLREGEAALRGLCVKEISERWSNSIWRGALGVVKGITLNEKNMMKSRHCPDPLPDANTFKPTRWIIEVALAFEDLCKKLPKERQNCKRKICEL